MITQLFKPYYRVEEILTALRPILESGWTGTGPCCEQFEQEWSNKIGAKHSVFVSSCTAALHLAVRVLPIASRSKILTTPITFVSTNAVILYEGHTPVFGDIDKRYMCLDPDIVKYYITTGKVSAVIWVHYGGIVHPEFLNIVKLAKEHGVYIIEDCAHAAGAFYPGERVRVGALDDTISCFSFHSVKNLPTFDSGMLCTSNLEIAKRAKKLSWMGISKDTYARTTSSNNELYKWAYDIKELGWKYNGNDVAAVFGLIGLKYLDEDNLYRKQLFVHYETEQEIALLKNMTAEPKVDFLNYSSTGSFHIIAGWTHSAKERELMIDTLKRSGFVPGVHYTPNFLYEPFKPFYMDGQCPNAQAAGECLISLPNNLHMTLDIPREIMNAIYTTWTFC